MCLQLPAVEGRDFRRARILESMAVVVCERGYAGTSVSRVCARAKVSRRTFYELFEGGLEDCFLAVLDDGARQAGAVIADAFERERSWLAGVRAALTDLLSLFDAKPLFARVWLVESLATGSWALERRERNIASITDLVVDYWRDPAIDVEPHRFVTDGVMASLHALLQAHLMARHGEPVTVLLGQCMGIVTSPYLEAGLVEREIERGESLARAASVLSGTTQCSDRDPDVSLPDTLRDPRAHRARRCVLFLATHPGASNRQVARAVGIAKDNHISMLLTRLHRLGLLVKPQSRPGAPNAWSLSAHGLRVARGLQSVGQWGDIV